MKVRQFFVEIKKKFFVFQKQFDKFQFESKNDVQQLTIEFENQIENLQVEKKENFYFQNIFSFLFFSASIIR